ncbi:phage tail sheath family protein [Jatrophihabitans sp.]|uniref:phage tail sheath family protein n=1 Tax=Jatrophihabitans sp. TaxID=1932789 RepID=UPI002EF12EEB
MTAGLRLGAPGVYSLPPAPDRRLQPVRLDVAGFAGVALRGPTDQPITVTRWTEYQQVFGDFEQLAGAPERLLPYAVRAFFAQGGERAVVLRVAPRSTGDTDDAEADAATARYQLDLGPAGTVQLRAQSEGSWANSLNVVLSFQVNQTFSAELVAPDRFTLAAGLDPPPWSLLRVRRRGEPVGRFGWLAGIIAPVTPTVRYGVLQQPLPDGASDQLQLDVITGTLTVSDPSAPLQPVQSVTGAGLHPNHPRWLAGASNTPITLVQPAGTWPPIVPPSALLEPVPGTCLGPGADRPEAIGYPSFFDAGDAGDDPLDELPHHGADLLARDTGIGLLCLPDLTWRAFAAPTAAETTPPAPAPACCPGCSAPSPQPDRTPEPLPPPIGLDPQAPADLAELERRQVRLVALAEARRRFVVLLDVPDGLPARRITDWRTAFDSSYAAAYHPWLGVPRERDPQRRAVHVPPSAFAAGIIAARERLRGLPWGPANELAQTAVLAAAELTDATSDQLHLLGINVYRAERDGFRLTAARTMSSDPDYRQLSVRRLMTMIALTLERQTQWLVFEPNTELLRARLTHTLTQFLRGLFRGGAFAGATETESFFVRCDDSVNPPASLALGRLVAEVGVAPAAPLEYLILTISQQVDGSVTVVSNGG